MFAIMQMIRNLKRNIMMSVTSVSIKKERSRQSKSGVFNALCAILYKKLGILYMLIEEYIRKSNELLWLHTSSHPMYQKGASDWLKSLQFFDIFLDYFKNSDMMKK